MTKTSRRAVRSHWSITAVSAACSLLAIGLGTPAAAQDIAESLAEAAGVPQIDAFLPDKFAVEPTEALPIDGVWTINTIGKKIRIEEGRAYAVDSWLHMFILKVQPDMVVMQNFQRTAPGQYKADDLPLLGPATFSLQPDGNLAVSVQGSLGPVGYKLIKREVDDEFALQDEIAAMRGEAPPDRGDPIYDDEPGGDDDPLAECENLGVDPATDDVICLD